MFGIRSYSAIKLSLVSLFNGIPIFVGYLMPNPAFKKNSSGTIKLIAGRKRGSYFCQGYSSESESNSATGVRTRLLRFRSPSL